MHLEEGDSVIGSNNKGDEEDWELTASGFSSDNKGKGNEKDVIELVGKEEDDEYILVSKEADEKDTIGVESKKHQNEDYDDEENNIKCYKSCYQKLNFWNDENEYEYILKKVVIT